MRPPKSHSVSRRLFYALLFPEEVTQRIAEALAEVERLDLDRSIRWTARENLHLTLRFLGEVRPAQIEQAMTLPGGLQPPGPIGLRGGEPLLFPSPRRPRVLTLGVSGVDRTSEERLGILQRQLEETALQLGLPAEERRFTPHITLGRVRRGGRPSTAVMEGLTGWDPDVGSIVCRRLSLMESHLEQKGAHYHEIHSWPLSR